jgi:hypothetical protein
MISDGFVLASPEIKAEHADENKDAGDIGGSYHVREAIGKRRLKIVLAQSAI